MTRSYLLYIFGRNYTRAKIVSIYVQTKNKNNKEHKFVSNYASRLSEWLWQIKGNIVLLSAEWRCSLFLAIGILLNFHFKSTPEAFLLLSEGFLYFITGKKILATFTTPFHILQQQHWAANTANKFSLLSDGVKIDTLHLLLPAIHTHTSIVQIYTICKCLLK